MEKNRNCHQCPFYDQLCLNVELDLQNPGELDIPTEEHNRYTDLEMNEMVGTKVETFIIYDLLVKNHFNPTEEEVYYIQLRLAINPDIPESKELLASKIVDYYKDYMSGTEQQKRTKFLAYRRKDALKSCPGPKPERHFLVRTKYYCPNAKKYIPKQ